MTTGGGWARELGQLHPVSLIAITIEVAIFYLFSQLYEIDISLLILQKQPKQPPNLFQRGVEHDKYTRSRLKIPVFSDPAPGKSYATIYEQMGS